MVELQEMEWLEIGTIVAAQGLGGEVRVKPDSDFPERFIRPGQRWLQRSPQSPPEPIRLLQGRLLPHKGLYILKLAGIENRTQAEALRGSLLLVPRSDRPKLAPGEFYLQDLLGLEVFEQGNQTFVGVITGVIPAGNDLLEVQPSQADRPAVLIPLVREIVPLVDLAAQRVEINPPPGLLS